MSDFVKLYIIINRNCIRWFHDASTLASLWPRRFSLSPTKSVPIVSNSALIMLELSNFTVEIKALSAPLTLSR